jgi:hypothetical protein
MNRLAFKASLVAATAAAVLAAPALAETKTYSFNAFTKLDIAAGYEVVFTQSPNRSITVDSSDFSKVTVEQSGDTLKIGRPKDTNLKGRRDPDIVRISGPELKAAELNAGVKFSADNVNTGDLVLDVNAGVEARFRNLKAQTIRLDANAGVKIDLDGTCTKLTIEASAGVEIDAKDLKCREARVDAEVGSQVRVHATDAVTAQAGIGASVQVGGNPKSVDKHASLGGSVTLRE